jgi:alpha-2-macroglobulin
MVAFMKRCLLMVLCFFCLVTRGQEHPGRLPAFAEGERLFAEGSYQLASKVYESVSVDDFSNDPEIQTWITFRLLDCEWRALAGSRQVDSTVSDKIWLEFGNLLNQFEAFDAHADFYQLRATMLESAGDFWWVTRNRRSWPKAWGHYEKALKLWAASPDVEIARERYLAIVWKASHPPEVNLNYTYGRYDNYLPASILENAIKIAVSSVEKSHANFLLAVSLQRQLNQSPYMHERVVRAFNAATAGKIKHAWMDDALVQYADWLASQGKPVKEPNGNWRFRPDYPSAVKIWRRLVDWYDREETRHYRQAEARLKDVTEHQLNVMVSHAFIPGSVIRLHTQWRNIDRFQLKLFKVDLVKNLHLDEGGHSPSEWIKTLKVRELDPVYDKTVETGDKRDHERGAQEIVLDRAPKDGAYLAVGYVDGTEQSRELVLISRLSVVARASTNRTLVWVCDSVDGHPLPGADVKLWQRVRVGRQWRWNSFDRKADEQGLVVFEDMGDFPSMDWLATARFNDQQNLSLFPNPRRNAYSQPWKIYAFTDRPAYRPEDLVHWKAIIRNQSPGGYTTPVSEKIKIRLRDPKGSIVMDDTVTLNTFGTVAGQWQPTKESPLGMYHIECVDVDDKRIGGAELFRLEEYKRPEMNLSIGIPSQDGDKPKTPRPGDKVVLEAHAEYYFGGDVVSGEAEVRVYRKPYHFTFPNSKPFQWLSDPQQRNFASRNSSSETLEHELKLKTDASGKVLIEFDSSPDLSTDMSYRIEVRVTDASRREIVAQHEVRVARQGHYALIKADHQLVRPGEKVTFDVHVMDVNEQPVTVDGQVKILQKKWREVWWSPEGIEIEGAPLFEIKQRHAVFPPPPVRPDQRPWRLKERGYTEELVLERTLRTDDEGRVESVFTPEHSGFYSTVWISQDDREGALSGPGNEVRSKEDFWVSHQDTRGLGYHSDGVEIIVDKDTFQSGQTAPVMLSVPTNDRWVLLTIESDHMHEHRVIHVDGTVRMVPIDIDQAHIPNFYIQAMMVSDHEIHSDTERITVPPVQEFLNVEVVSNQQKYAPRETAELEIKVSNHLGDPVEGEVSVAVYDESVTYIQQEIAGDPREVFYGKTRPLVSHQSGHWRSFEKLVALKDGSVIYESQYRHWIEMGIDPNRYDEEVSLFIQRGQMLGDGTGGIDPLTGLPLGFGGEFGAGSGGFGIGGGGGPIGGLRMSASAPRSMMKSEVFFAEALSMQADSAPDAAFSGDSEATVIVRHDFNATAFWEPTLRTDAKGHGRVAFELPDSLTTWKVNARAINQDTKVGNGSASFDTRRPLLIRLQTPRFLVMGDKAMLSAIVNNQTESPVRAQVTFESDQIIWEEGIEAKQTITVPANGELRIDWSGAMALEPGEIKLKAIVRSEDDADAVEMSLNAYEHGLEQLLAWSGKSYEEEISFPVKFPELRKPESTQLIVQVTPSLAVTMLDALPYLIDFPYGCSEQTMSRFLPAAIVKHTLLGVGLSMDEIKPGAFGGVDSSQIKNTHRTGFEALSETDRVTTEGLKRLIDMQHGDGGWGWWEDGSSDLFMTAYVVWGLSLARDAGVEFELSLLNRGRNYLASNIVRAENQLDRQSWMLHALYTAGVDGLSVKLSEAIDTAWVNLWERRDSLNAYSRALLALSAHRAGKSNAAMTLVRNLENGIIRTEAAAPSRLQSGTLSGASAATAHWGEDGIYQRWSDGGVEATAMALRAILAVDPNNALVEPVVRWLINNRRGAHWSNTRDTAMSLLALTDYLKVSGELETDLQYELYAGEKLVAAERVTSKNIFKAPSRFVIPSALIQDTTDIRIVRTSGKSPIYYGIEAEYYSLENPIPAAGNELFVRRDYFLLKETPTLLKGSVLDRVPLLEGNELQSGDRVEVVLTLESRNHYEYLLIEDLKPAGLEAVAIQSGVRVYARELSQRGIEQLEAGGQPAVKPDLSWRFSGRSQSLHQEWRDRKVALFMDKLPEGLWEIRYTMRAEVPGHFSAMPAVGHAMYIPEIRGNSKEEHFHILDRSKD